MDRYYDALRVTLHIERMGEDLCIAVFGGDRPHIGSVAIAEPRESLRRDGSRSATVSIFNFPGHKDGEIASNIAHGVAARLDRRTVVLCGLHYDSFSTELLAQMRELTARMVEDVCRELDDSHGT